MTDPAARDLRLTLVRTGGFAAIRRTFTVDAATLPPAERDELDSLVTAAKVFDLPDDLTGGRPGQPDQFIYALTAEAGSRRHTVRFGETGAPDSLLALVDFIQRHAAKPG